ncbi:MAG: hypothetical protein HFE60_12695 [Anaerotignum sp.]|jgi:hypothetical protein|nr:hypothetical protein [Anaerotignum sp.]
MAINTLEYAKIFSQTLDRQMLAEATSGWMEANAGQVKYSGGNEVKIPMISTSGLGDYDRDEGFKRGAVTLSYQTMIMTQDRGRTFHLDAMDVDETNFVAAAGNVMGEFQRLQVVPEIDAYRYSRIAALAAAKDRAAEQTVTAENVLSLLLADIAKIRDEIGDATELVISMSGLVTPLLAQSKEMQKKIDVSDFKKGEVSMKVKSLDGCPILPVPSARMKTTYMFYDGETTGQEGGGFKPAEGAKAINWIIMPRNVPIAVSKTDVTRIFDPMTNQQAHAWKIDYRKYHDLWIPENRLAAVWVSKEA